MEPEEKEEGEEREKEKMRETSVVRHAPSHTKKDSTLRATYEAIRRYAQCVCTHVNTHTHTLHFLGSVMFSMHPVPYAPKTLSCVAMLS